MRNFDFYSSAFSKLLQAKRARFGMCLALFVLVSSSAIAADMRFSVVAIQSDAGGDASAYADDPGDPGSMGAGMGNDTTVGDNSDVATITGANASAVATSDDGMPIDISSLATAMTSNFTNHVSALNVPQCGASSGVLGGVLSSFDGAADSYAQGYANITIRVVTLDPGYVTALVGINGGGGGTAVATANGVGYQTGDPTGTGQVNFGWQPAGFQVELHVSAGTWGFAASQFGLGNGSYNQTAFGSASLSGIISAAPSGNGQQPDDNGQSTAQLTMNTDSAPVPPGGGGSGSGDPDFDNAMDVILGNNVGSTTNGGSSSDNGTGGTSDGNGNQGSSESSYEGEYESSYDDYDGGYDEYESSYEDYASGYDDYESGFDEYESSYDDEF